VLHHFGSKDELLRRIADRALATVELPLPSADWRADLRNVAVHYQDLALSLIHISEPTRLRRISYAVFR
ncbi:MAG TPA: hypothetical protein DCQ79_04725, partial [Rhizobiales bacterium]|nr:hypothetical protein [Hyphomicrobiales bacterium]